MKEKVDLRETCVRKISPKMEDKSKAIIIVIVITS